MRLPTVGAAGTRGARPPTVRSAARCALLGAAVAAAATACERGGGESRSVALTSDTTRRDTARADTLRADTLRADTLRADTLRFGPFGRVVVARRAARPSRVALVVAGEGAREAIARELTTLDALVVTVDDRRYLASHARARGSCAYPAADLETLSQYVQKRAGLARYTPPVLIGGPPPAAATLVYATLAQAPPHTFAGAISVGFRPDLALDTPPCTGPGGLRTASAAGTVAHRVVLPAAQLAAPWTVVSVAAAEDSAAAAFVRQTALARLVTAPPAATGRDSATRTPPYLPALRSAFSAMASAPPADADDRAPADVAVRDLPLVEVPAASASPSPRSSDLLAVVVSGDGGWASIDRSVAGAMAARGVPVVGWNSLQYLWNGSTPDSAAHDLARVLDHYLAAWGKRRAVLVGYSLGADVLPFMAARLPAELRGRVAAVGLLAPSRAVSFEFHLSDWLGSGGGDLPVRPEIVRLRRALAPPVSILCIYGTADAADAACPGLPAGAATIVALGGGHHFGGDYAALADRVLRAAGATTAAP